MNRAWFWLLLIFACETQAFSTGSLSGIIKTSSGYVFKTGTVSAGAVTGSAVYSVSGKTIVMPMTATLKTTAPSVLVAAARLTPTSLVVGLTASWLLEYGLEYANNAWTKRTQGETDTTGIVGFYWRNAIDSTQYAGAGSACSAYCADPQIHASVCTTGTTISGPSQAGWSVGKYITTCTASGRGSGFSTISEVVARLTTCSPGYTLTNGNCVPNAQQVPATESDFAVPSAQTSLPDGVAQEAAPKIAEGLPVNIPTMPSTPLVTAIGDPYIDPVTGQTKQPFVKLTPSPTAEDPARVDVQAFEKEIAPADPAKAEPDAIPPEASEPKDPCLENPNRIGCLDAGDPNDETLQTKDVTLALTPVTVGGAGSCPAIKTFTHAGITYSFSYAPICTGATLIKPVVLAIAWLLAAYIVLGANRET